jgi:predicted DCC family thiol-disulfide oxidoreductase YuxK
LLPSKAHGDSAECCVYQEDMAKVIIWYDGACPLCTREIALLQKLDRRQAIEFCDASSFDTACPIDRQMLLERFHASEDGVMLSGAAAFAAMWRAIPLLRPLGWIARNAIVLRILERFYLRFLCFRPTIQRFFQKA